MAHEYFDDYISLVNDTLDMITYGYRQEHSAVFVPEDKADTLGILESDVSGCTSCQPSGTGGNRFPGRGSLQPLVMVIADKSSAIVDKETWPFTLDAGRFLESWLEAIDLSINQHCYVTTLLKCNDSETLQAQTRDFENCQGFLERQLALLQPSVILSLGTAAGHALSGSSEKLEKLRCMQFDYKGVPVISTYDPVSVLSSPGLKRPVWEDLKKLRKLLENRL